MKDELSELLSALVLYNVKADKLATVCLRPYGWSTEYGQHKDDGILVKYQLDYREWQNVFGDPNWEIVGDL